MSESTAAALLTLMYLERKRGRPPGGATLLTSTPGQIPKMLRQPGRPGRPRGSTKYSHDAVQRFRARIEARQQELAAQGKRASTTEALRTDMREHYKSNFSELGDWRVEELIVRQLPRFKTLLSRNK